MRKLLLLSLFFGLSGTFALQAQTTFELPQNAELKSKDDYAKYESVMIEAANWLEQTDLDKEPDKRKEINAFVLQWITGSPTITVDINEQLVKLYGKNAQLIAIYLSSYAKEFLGNKTTATKYSAIKAGLESMMNVYKKGVGITRSKEMEKLIKLTEDNKLDDYIKTNFK